MKALHGLVNEVGEKSILQEPSPAVKKLKDTDAALDPIALKINEKLDEKKLIKAQGFTLTVCIF